jgi:hypothetical protein
VVPRNGLPDCASLVALATLGGMNFSSIPKWRRAKATSRYEGVYGAQEWTRTITSLRILAPEASASTNFTTWARGEQYYSAGWASMSRARRLGLGFRVWGLGQRRQSENRQGAFQPESGPRSGNDAIAGTY